MDDLLFRGATLLAGRGAAPVSRDLAGRDGRNCARAAVL